MKPFLRWVGGKQNLVKLIAGHIPSSFSNTSSRYFEPFLGAAALFFNLNPINAVLSDLNEHLINCYISIKENPRLIHRYLKIHNLMDSNNYYYQVREKFNDNIHTFSHSQSARFLYLNRSCYNGIFRVNTKGQFNVPYGFKENLLLPQLSTLLEISKVLQNAELHSCSYKEILPFVSENDFVYLDPPYPPLNGTAYFTHYTKERFGLQDQMELANFAKKLVERGCKVIISNADTPIIRELYSDWEIFNLPITRWVSCKSKRNRVNELILLKYR